MLVVKGVELLQKIREFYLVHKTEESKRRDRALTEIRDELNGMGIESVLLIGGSLAAGMSIKAEDENSDIDLMYVGDVNSFHAVGWKRDAPSAYFNGQYFIHCGLEEELGYPVHVDYFEDGDLPYIRRTLSGMQGGSIITITEDLSKLAIFYSRYKWSVPLSNALDPIIKQIDALRATNEEFDRSVRQTNLGTDFWGRSFDRYHQRLFQRDIEVPEGQLAIEQKFLELVKTQVYQPI